MGDIPRIPTRFGQGHADGIGFLQDEVLARFIKNELVTLVVIGLTTDGDEIRFLMNDVSGAVAANQRTLGLIADIQQEWRDDMRQPTS